MNYNKCFALLCVVVLLISTLGGCTTGEATLKKIIVGRWTSGGDHFITFYKNGIGDDDGDRLTYEIVDGNITIVFEDGYTETYTVEIYDNNHLALESNYVIELYRCDAEGRIIIGE